MYVIETDGKIPAELHLTRTGWINERGDWEKLKVSLPASWMKKGITSISAEYFNTAISGVVSVKLLACSAGREHIQCRRCCHHHHIPDHIAWCRLLPYTSHSPAVGKHWRSHDYQGRGYVIMAFSTPCLPRATYSWLYFNWQKVWVSSPILLTCEKYVQLSKGQSEAKNWSSLPPYTTWIMTPDKSEIWLNSITSLKLYIHTIHSKHIQCDRSGHGLTIGLYGVSTVIVSFGFWTETCTVWPPERLTNLI